MKPEVRKHYKNPSKENCIKAKHKKTLKNWWEDTCKCCKTSVRFKVKQQIHKEMKENT